MMVIVGIDPGAKGAIAMWHFNYVGMPYMEVSKIYSKDNTFQHSFLELVHKVSKESTKVYVEKVNGIPTWGYKNFGFGKAFGEILGILAVLELPYELVSAQTWQKNIYDSGSRVKRAKVKGLSDKEKNKAKAVRYKAKKDANRALAKRLFPKFGYLLDKKGNDGIADALLIMEYGRREMGFMAHIGISTEGVDVAKEDIFK